MLTTEQKYLGMRYAMLVTLNSAIFRKDYSCLQQLHELSQITNNELAQLVHQKRAISQPPKEAVFTDIAALIFHKSEKNAAILEAFYNYYSVKFPDLIKKLEKAESLFLKNHTPLDGFIEKSKTRSKDMPIPTERAGFAFFLLFYSNVIDDIEVYGYRFSDFCRIMEYACFTIDDTSNGSFFTLDTGEDIFTCKQYKSFLEKRKAELVETVREYFNCEITDAAELPNVLGNLLQSRSTDKGIPISPYVNEIVKNCARDVLVEQNGGILWYEQVTFDPKRRSGYTLQYSPNLDNLIDIYYKNVVKHAAVRSYVMNKKRITRFTLARERISASPLVDLFCIMYMYNLDAYCRLFTTTLEDYYTNFSWEKITKTAMEERYSRIISSLDEQIASMAKKNSFLAGQNRSLSLQISKNAGVDAHPYEKAISDLNKEVEERDDEIAALKAQLASKERFIELLSSTDDPDIGQEIDLEFLKTKRYLFVGRTSEIAPQLRMEFPNSLFMENEGFSLQNIKVDGIVMLIKGMSHAMFYKINSTSTLDDLPIARCNTRNINTIYQAMHQMKLS